MNVTALVGPNGGAAPRDITETERRRTSLACAVLTDRYSIAEYGFTS